MAMSHTDTMTQTTGDGGAAGQFLTFRLGDEEYGVDILKVQEIKGYVPTTRVPNAPPEVVGVLNLRGTVVPITDLRRKFGMEAITYNSFNAIVVVVVDGRVMGVLVDQVSDVVSIPEADIQPPTEYGDGSHSQMVQGMGKIGDKLIILLDIDAVLLGEGAVAARAA